MTISSFDLISPKITLNYNGHNSHISRIGGFLSLCLIITLCISIFYYVWGLINPRHYSTFLYEENVEDSKYLQKINFSGINHFLQIYSRSNDGWFGNIDNRNIIIYAIKENNNIYNKNYINTIKSKKSRSSPINKLIKKDKNKKSKEKKIKFKFSPDQYYLIQIDANNTCRKVPPNSNIILDNYQYETAIKYDKRDFFRILYICLLSKEHILKAIFFKIPIFMRGLNLCLLIFIYSSDLALNTMFYTNEKISEKYHYEGTNLLYFSLVNNIVKSLLSAIITLVLVNIFQFLIDSRIFFEAVFRKEEKKMRKNKNYTINIATKKKILK
jgi:hypothetical protein